MEINNIRIKEFLNTEVNDFALYVLRSRAMPNIMDGIRIGARKILWAGMNGDLSKKSFIKLPALIGDTLKMGYHHGDASLAQTIVGLCLKHNCKYSPLEAIGQVSSLRVPNVDVATRYLSVKRSEYFDLFLTDKELLEVQEEEGEQIEPKYFLPIIPMVLLNRTNSPGFGFSFRSFSYNIDDIIDNLILSIKRGTCQLSNVTLRPEIEGIKPQNIIYNSNKDKWYNIGEYKVDFESSILEVTDLPYNVSFEEFEKTLTTLKEQGVITAFHNLSEGDDIKYTMKVNNLRGRYQDKWKFYKTFRLFTTIADDILNCIDTDGKSILFFNNAYELIDTFVKKRLVYYQARKTRTIQILTKKIQDYTHTIEFIRLVISGKIVINNKKKDEIRKQLVQYSLPERVMELKMWTLTNEEITSIERKIQELQAELDYIRSTSIEDMYIFDLIAFKQKLNKIQHAI